MNQIDDDGLDIDKPNVRAFIYIMGLLIAAIYAGIIYGLYKLIMWIWSLLPL